MRAVIKCLLVCFIVMTFVTFLIGIVGMVQNNAFYQKNANFLMRLRVLFQGLALAIFAVLLLMGE